MELFTNTLASLLESVVVLAIVIVFFVTNRLIFQKFKKDKDSSIVTRQTVSIFIILIGTLAFILNLPIDKSLKGQLLSFLGIIISAAIALSSTTVLGNLIAGIMNNSMDRFKMGDLIKVGDLTGRVTKKNIFHTEIQLEDSNFVTVPNLYISSNPVKLTRKTNTVISTTISLGYNIPQLKIVECLKNAALATGLKDPYVYITSLIDSLHESGTEIVSPTFMNQRRADDTIFIPKKNSVKKEDKQEKSPEELIFDKAIEAGAIEKNIAEHKNNLDNAN